MVHRVRRGYDVAEVDDFLDALAAAIGSGGEVPRIEDVRFSPTRGGYDERQVDDFLADLAQQLGQNAS